MVEPGATLCVMKLLIVVALKSGMTAITGTPRSSSSLLNGYHDECRAAPPELAAPSDPGLGTANRGVVDFYLAMKRLAHRIHRRSPQLVKYHPSGLVTLKTKLVMEKQRRDPSLIGRHQVGRPEPEGQRGLRIVKDGPRCQGHLLTTGGALPGSSSHRNRDRARIVGTCSPRTSGKRPGTLGRPLRWRTESETGEESRERTDEALPDDTTPGG